MISLLSKIIYKVGVARRNPALNSYYKFLQDSDKWSLEKLESYQLAKCKEFMEFAYLYSPFYKELFDSVGFDPIRFESFDDLKKIPIIDKAVLLQRTDKIHTNYKFKKKFFSETSGTSGQVLKFYRNEEWDSYNRASMFRGYSWYGIKPWDRNGYFWGYNIDKKQQLKTRSLDSIQNRFRLFSYKETEIISFINKLGTAKFISGYSSMIYEVAKIVNRLGVKSGLDLRMIKGTSEKIYDSYQEEVKKAFGLKIISEYGSAESGLIAFECPEGGNMHIVSENVIVEEENNEIIVTNLNSKSFPIIRYKLGDSIKLAPKDYVCKCGRKHQIIFDVLGRVGKNIIGNNNIYPSLTFYYVFKNLALNNKITLNYQAIQNERGKVILKIEQNNSNIISLLEAELIKYFNSDIDFTIIWGQKLHKMDGKLKDFITTLS